MRLSRNLVSLGLLLFGLGAIFGSLLIATFGQTLGTIVGLFFVLVILGVLIFEPRTRQ